jgi:hypothetical protein
MFTLHVPMMVKIDQACTTENPGGLDLDVQLEGCRLSLGSQLRGYRDNNRST